jgi:hypothetical protein
VERRRSHGSGSPRKKCAFANCLQPINISAVTMKRLNALPDILEVKITAPAATADEHSAARPHEKYPSAWRASWSYIVVLD